MSRPNANQSLVLESANASWHGYALIADAQWGLCIRIPSDSASFAVSICPVRTAGLSNSAPAGAARRRVRGGNRRPSLSATRHTTSTCPARSRQRVRSGGPGSRAPPTPPTPSAEWRGAAAPRSAAANSQSAFRTRGGDALCRRRGGLPTHPGHPAMSPCGRRYRGEPDRSPSATCHTRSTCPRSMASTGLRPPSRSLGWSNHEPT